MLLTSPMDDAHTSNIMVLSARQLAMSVVVVIFIAVSFRFTIGFDGYPDYAYNVVRCGHRPMARDTFTLTSDAFTDEINPHPGFGVEYFCSQSELQKRKVQIERQHETGRTN